MKFILPIIRFILPYKIRIWLHIAWTGIWSRIILQRIRNKVRRRESIKVIFLVSEVAKWKCQSLYDLMRENENFTPIVGIMRQDADSLNDGKCAIQKGIENAEGFFARCGCITRRVYDVDKMEYINLKTLSPDLVFYQQPWNVNCSIWPYVVCRYALTVYVPYFVPNYYYDNLTYGLLFHQFIFYYFTLNNDEQSRALSVRRKFNFVGSLPVVGHPMLDDFYLHPMILYKNKCVIYAPHFTFTHPNNDVAVHYSTFLETGELILNYARKHPEVEWIFKPHPVLKTALRKSGAWTESQIESYYNEWDRIGSVCETGGYLNLFRKATLMITDCGSFLSEFAVTMQPIIHLINPLNILEGPEYFKTYYQAHNIDELRTLLSVVLEKGDDYKKDQRIAAIKKANIAGQYAGKNIIDFFSKEFRIRD